MNGRKIAAHLGARWPMSFKSSWKGRELHDVEDWEQIMMSVLYSSLEFRV